MPTRPDGSNDLPFRFYLIVLVVAMIVPMAVLTAWLAHREARDLTDEAAQLARQAADEAATRVGEILADHAWRIEHLAAMPSIRSMRDPACSHGLKHASTVLATPRETMVIALDGTILCTGEGTPAPGTAFEDRDWFKATVSGGIGLGDVRWIAATGRQRIRLGAPIRTEEGRIVGVIALSVDPADFSAVRAISRPPATVQIRIVDEAGTVLAGSALPADAIGRRNPAFARNTGKTTPAFSATDTDGVERTFHGTAIDHTRLRAYAGIDRRATEDALQRSLLQAGVGALAMVGAALALAFAIGGRLSRSVAAIRAAADAVADGRRDARIVPAGPAELRQVAASINAMLDALQGAEHERDRSRAELASILALTPALVARYAADGRLVYANAAFARTFGTTAERVVGTTVGSLPGIAGQAVGWSTMIERVVQTGIPERLDFPLVIDGHRRWFDQHIVPEHAPNGAVSGAIEVTQDVTDRIETDTALREREQEFRTLAAASAQLIWKTNAAGQLLEAAPDWRRYAGGPPCGDAGWDWLEAVHPDDREDVARTYRDALRNGDPFADELRARAADGGYRVLAVRGMPVPDATAGIRLWIHAASDIDARRHAEQQLSEQAHELRRLTQALITADEEGRRRLALELHDRIGQNLVALGLSLGIARQQIARHETIAATERLADASDLLERIVRRARDVMADLQPPMLDDYGLPDALRWYAARFANRSDIEVVVGSADAATRLPRDVEAAMFRIAQEAIVNAARHADAERIRVEIREEDRWCEVTITDDGKGMDMNGPPRVLRPGSGWGMLSMRERADATGCTLHIDDAPGGGTRITVRYPRPVPDHAAFVAAPAPPHAEPPAPLDRRQTADAR